MNTIQTKLQLKERAQGMVEFALALPFLLVLVLGVIEAGRLLFIYSATNTASREAARYGSAAGDIGGYVTHYEDCNGIRAAAKRMGSLAGIQDADISITYDKGPGTSSIASCNPTFSIDDSSIEDVNLGDRVVVQVRTNYRPIVPLVNLPPFQISTVARRVIVKDVAIEGTPRPSTTPTVTFRRLDKAPGEKETDAPEDFGMVVIVAELSAVSSRDVTVPFTVSGTATNGDDFTITPSPVVIPSGMPSARIEIPIIDDPTDEYDETIMVTMQTPINANKGEPFYHRLTILDNDNPPTIFFTEASQSKSEDGGTMTVIAQLSLASAKNITVPFGLTGDAIEGEDYTISTSPISIPSGSLSATILITINPDVIDEDDETIVITLLDPPPDPIDNQPNVILGSPNPHQATILDDDTAYVSFVWESQDLAETNNNAIIQVQLSTPSSKDVTVRFTVDPSSTATESGTTPLGEEDDYDIMPSPIVIPKGELTADIDFIPKTDAYDEEPESVIVVLGTPTNAELGLPDVHTVWITNTPPEAPTVFFSQGGQSAYENAGSMTVVVQISHAYIHPVDVDILVGGTATRNLDYSVSPTHVSIPPGGKSAFVTITLMDDVINEANETAVLTLDKPVHASLGAPSSHTATILDDDAQPNVYFQMSTQSASEDQGSMLVTVRLSAVSGRAVTIPYSVSGTATQGTDYTITAGPVTIPAGSASTSIVITLIDDSVVGEGEETVLITMGTPTNAMKGSPDVHSARIIDNDQVPCPDLGPITFNDIKLSLPVSHMSAGAEATTITGIAVNWNDVPNSQKLQAVSFNLAPIWTFNDNTPPTYIPSEGSWNGASSDRLLNPGASKTLQFEFFTSMQTPFSGYSVTVSFDNGCVVSRTGGS